MSARRRISGRSRVLEWQMVTVALACIRRRAMGLPTMSLRPRTTALAPSISISLRRRISMQPAGVQATRPGRPLTRRPRLTGWKPSTSLVDAKRILEAVDPAKDVDGFHPVNLGRLVSGRPGLVACTPAGCMEILRRNEIEIEGANAAVLGRSDIVGKPMALLLMHANATVTICHSKTRDLPDVVRRADIIVAAMGKAGFVQPDWIKTGAAVIDVGTNRVTDAKEAERLFRDFPDRLEKFRAKGSALVGDVHPGAINTAGALTPVPGGVGPMTITMLMSNTAKAARLRRASPRISATQSTASAR